MKRWPLFLAAVLAARPLNAQTCRLTPTDENHGVGVVDRRFAPYLVESVISPSSIHINVKDCGAKGDGVADDTPAMQAAHNTGALVYYPAGTYKFTTISGFSNGGIIGDGPGKTILLSTDVTSANLITFTGSLPAGGITAAGVTNAPLFADFTLKANASKTSGAGIQINPTTGESSYGHFINIVFASTPIGVDFVAASFWKIIGCEFLGYTVAGVQVANTNNQDSGDNSIEGGNLFETNTGLASAPVGVLQHSSGGLKIIGNKFLGGAWGYRLDFNPVGNTGNLQISGNSMEQADSASIAFRRTANAASFKNILIAYNEFGVQQVQINGDANAFLFQVNITGNVFNISGAASPAPLGIGLTGVTDIQVSANLFKGNGSSPTGVSCTSCTNGRIGPNKFINVTTNVTLPSSTGIEQWDPSVPGGTGASITQDWTLARAGSTTLGLQSTNGGADAKNWRLYSTASNSFIIDAINDALTVANTALQINRSGATPTSIQHVVAIQDAANALTCGASTTPAVNANLGNYFTCNITANVAVVVQPPTNAPAAGFSQTIYIALRNSSGGALTTAPTFSTAANGFKFLAGSIVNPTNGTQVVYQFRWDQLQGFWYECETPITTPL